jgi:hypothetical protein
MATQYQIWDSGGVCAHRTAIKVGKPYTCGKRARTRAEKLNLEYGAHRYSVRPVVSFFRDIPAPADAYTPKTPGEPGYQPLYVSPRITLEELDEMCARMNDTRKPTEAERQAAQIGSMFGWHVPGADPAYWEAEHSN